MPDLRRWDLFATRSLPGDGHGELKRVMFPKAERGFLSRAAQSHFFAVISAIARRRRYYQGIVAARLTAQAFGRMAIARRGLLRQEARHLRGAQV